MWLGGTLHSMADYNGWADSWAAYIALERLRLVQFPPFQESTPRVTKALLASELPDSPLRNWMISKRHDIAPLPGDHDVDAPPAIAVMRSDYIVETKRVSFSHWERWDAPAPHENPNAGDPHEMPIFKDDPQGRAIVVMKANG